MARKLSRTKESKNVTQKEFVCLIASMSLVLSSTMLVHEIGNRFLLEGFIIGFPVNARAISCLAHVSGVVAGLAFAAAHSTSRPKRTPTIGVWAAAFSLLAILYAVFYLTLHPHSDASISCLIQIASGIFGGFFFICCMRFVSHLDETRFIRGVISFMASTAFIAYGLFGTVQVTTNIIFLGCTHIVLLIAGAIAFLWLAFVNESTSAIFASNSAPSVKLSKKSESTSGIRMEPFAFLWIALCVYGAVFGVLHVIPLGLPATQLSRVISNLLGITIAAIFVRITLPQHGISTTIVWNRLYRFVFPFVTLAALLIAFTGESGFIPSLACAESAQYFFDMILAIACFTVCRTTGVQAPQVFAQAFFARYVGFLVGDFIGMLLHEFVPMTTETFNAIGIAVFLLLMVVTFNVNAEKYAKTAWGIIPKESPKALYRRNMSTRCEQLANENHLTAREREVLLLLAEGKRPKEISEELVVSVATVRTHVQGVYSKLDVHSYDDLFKLLRKND